MLKPHCPMKRPANAPSTVRPEANTLLAQSSLQGIACFDHNSKKSIRIGFTDQKSADRLGCRHSATFWAGIASAICSPGCCRSEAPISKRVAEDVRPSLRRRSRLVSIAGILSGAQRLAHVAFLRADPMLCQLFVVSQIASQSTLSASLLVRGSVSVP